MGRIIKAPAESGPLIEEPPQDPRQAAEVYESARREGFAAGHAEGVAQAAVVLASARAEGERAWQSLTPAAIGLARQMAEKIVGRAVALDEGVTAEIAAEALSAVRPDLPAVRLRLNPEDLAAVEQRRDRLAARAPAMRIDLIADDAVARHGCVIDTPGGRVDARLETQLDALERAVRGEAGDA